MSTLRVTDYGEATIIVERGDADGSGSEPCVDISISHPFADVTMASLSEGEAKTLIGALTAAARELGAVLEAEAALGDAPYLEMSPRNLAVLAIDTYHRSLENDRRAARASDDAVSRLSCENQELREELRFIAETDPADAALDPDRARRVAAGALERADRNVD